VSDVSFGERSTGWTDPEDQYASTPEEVALGTKPIGPQHDDSFPYTHYFDPPGGIP